MRDDKEKSTSVLGREKKKARGQWREDEGERREEKRQGSRKEVRGGEGTARPHQEGRRACWRGKSLRAFEGGRRDVTATANR